MTSRVIDARVRLPLERWPAGARALPPEEYRTRYDAVLDLTATRERTVADLLADLAEAGVDHAIAHAEYEFGDHVDGGNEGVAALVAEYPERFTGFGTVSMERYRVLRAVRQVQRVADLGLVGVNVQPSFFGVAIDERALYPVYAKAAELGLAVAVHTGINYSTVHPIRNDHPLQLDQVACDLPELVLIACHGGWPWVAEMVAVARKHPQVLMDFGGLAPRYLGEPGSGWEVLHRFANSLLADQVMFATDWPVFGMRRAVTEWRALGLKPDVLDKALGGNAERLLW